MKALNDVIEHLMT